MRIDANKQVMIHCEILLGTEQLQIGMCTRAKGAPQRIVPGTSVNRRRKQKENERTGRKIGKEHGEADKRGSRRGA